jgi:hypothetical protein
MAIWLTVTAVHGLVHQINFDLISERRPTFPYELGATRLTMSTGKYLYIQETEEQLMNQAKQARNL